ncbi:MAG: helix-turn-helix transcriptional regulator [Planctomycetota bacterium]|nr:helix-turn-helix transcriptional regulator [Planctomycetota bacterium]MEC9010160.1 helix-turn-helix transcriptional regulator [Planctomycetota bacterium]MED5399351.1 helix-turn-helix transcriptional regulator [Planctomycetota bacterium]MEE3286214.1 helix-turn-helix transcriptional regulator [Planctomycetota bacterium]
MVTRSVAELCETENLTIDQLAEKTGLEHQRLLAILLGRWTPSPAERTTVARALDVAVDDITWGHKTPIQHIYGQGPG